MLSSLLILAAAAIPTFALGAWKQYSRLAGLSAILGASAALGVGLYLEWPPAAGLAGTPMAWPSALSWLGASVYRSDVLSSALGLWIIALGLLCLAWSATEPPPAEGADLRPGAILLAIAVAFSMVYTSDFGAFAAEALLFAIVVWLLGQGEVNTADGGARSLAAFALGAACLCGAALLVGRTTGGPDGLVDLSLAALTRWPLALIAAWAALWFGLVPFSGWSGRGLSGAAGALVQAIAGIPVIVLVLRLQELVTRQAAGAGTPAGWTTLMGILQWGGAITLVTAAAGMVVSAGSGRWSALLTSFWWGGAAWALGMDTPSGRSAALAIGLAFGVSRVTLALGSSRLGRAVAGEGSATRQVARTVGALSLAGAPLLGGFAGLWLLGAALVDAGRTPLALLVVGAAVVAAMGVALQFAAQGPGDDSLVTWGGPEERLYSFLGGLAAAFGVAILVVAGVTAGAWVQWVREMASVAGGDAPTPGTWEGLTAGGLAYPALLLGVAALIVVVLGRLTRAWAQAGSQQGGALLPTAIEVLTEQPRSERASFAESGTFLGAAPAWAWWLSLEWLLNGVWGLGLLVARLLGRIGQGLGRLEGRYFIPLAMLLALAAMLAVTR